MEFGTLNIKVMIISEIANKTLILYNSYRFSFYELGLMFFVKTIDKPV